MKIIFQVDGGIGKSIAATALCKARVLLDVSVAHPEAGIKAVSDSLH